MAPDLLEDLSDKTFLITGANTGAGFRATRILLAKGAKVVMLNRNETKSNKAIHWSIKRRIWRDYKSFIHKVGFG